jgi:hypothetical protein
VRMDNLTPPPAIPLQNCFVRYQMGTIL